MKEYQITYELDGEIKMEIVKAQNVKAAQTILQKKHPQAIIKGTHEIHKKW